MQTSRDEATEAGKESTISGNRASGYQIPFLSLNWTVFFRPARPRCVPSATVMARARASSEINAPARFIAGFDQSQRLCQPAVGTCLGGLARLTYRIVRSFLLLLPEQLHLVSHLVAQILHECVHLLATGDHLPRRSRQDRTLAYPQLGFKTNVSPASHVSHSLTVPPRNHGSVEDAGARRSTQLTIPKLVAPFLRSSSI